MKKTPHPHQTRAIDMLRGSIKSGKRRPMLQIATGGGKTFIAALIVESARSRGKRILFIVDAISLVDQTVDAFFAEGLHDIGVIQGNHPMEDWSKPIQIASVQTLRRRGMPPADIVIVDEAHCQDEWLKGIMTSEEWANVPFIGLSATPWSKGLGNVFDDLINPILMPELMDEGLLCQFKVYAAAHPDLSGLKTVAGDYHESQLSEVMSEGGLIADIVKTWKRRGEDRPTFAFCVDRAHAQKVRDRFVAAGIPWGYIDAYTERADRLAIKKQLERGEIKGVANVGCLTKGVDWDIRCIILARPTKSEMLYVQMVGRGLRTAPGKPDCIILDHADNTLRLGFVTDIHHPELCKATKGERKAQERKEALPKECPSCTYVKPPKVRECPVCHFVPEKISDIEEAEGELKEVTRAKMKASMATKQAWYDQLNAIRAKRGYSEGWVAQTYKKRFGVWPDHRINRFGKADPTPEVQNYVTASLIRYAKKRAA